MPDIEHEDNRIRHTDYAGQFDDLVEIVMRHAPLTIRIEGDTTQWATNISLNHLAGKYPIRISEFAAAVIGRQIAIPGNPVTIPAEGTYCDIHADRGEGPDKSKPVADLSAAPAAMIDFSRSLLQLIVRIQKNHELPDIALIIANTHPSLASLAVRTGVFFYIEGDDHKPIQSDNGQYFFGTTREILSNPNALDSLKKLYVLTSQLAERAAHPD